MKKIWFIAAIILALLLTGCTQNENKDENPSEKALPEASAQKLSPEERIFAENGSYGISDESGDVLVPAEYDEITWCGDFYAARWEDGKRKGVSVNKDGSRTYADVANVLYKLIREDGKFVDEEPFENFLYYNDEAFGEIVCTRDGSLYTYGVTPSNGEITLESVEPAGTLPDDRYGFRINYVYADGGRDRLYGIVNPDGSTAVYPIYYHVAVPFADRFLLWDGAPQQGFTCGRCNITDAYGNIINNSFNAAVYSTFDDGKYIGIACSLGENADFVCCTDGKVTPAGYWFVDKDGNILSERFDKISINEDFDSSKYEFMDYILTANDENAVVKVTLNAAEEEIPVTDILAKYYK